ncbi:MAG TPA: guanylate kinase [Candidatus Desulfofervidus auxilii]|uniref:Guanylate kinase n=1 Tax=Desulfofervidus auxilii TaxID=1621989 RepID=A0A7V0NEP8_DESA2|nr:guanylate kinase [Candidatus Desulfofervidus auxilii]
MKNKSCGNIFVISAPSGAGKTTLIRLLKSRFPKIVFSVSCTTRSPRPKEKHGKDYFFIKENEFKEMIRRGEMLEWAKVHGHYYGTPLKFVKERLAAGEDIILDIDVQGARQVKEKLPEATLIFILPPSWEELKRRLFKRSTESLEEINKRLKAAQKEIKAAETFDFIVINDEINKALKELEAIMLASKAKVEKRKSVIQEFLEEEENEVNRAR